MIDENGGRSSSSGPHAPAASSYLPAAGVAAGTRQRAAQQPGVAEPQGQQQHYWAAVQQPLVIGAACDGNKNFSSARGGTLLIM